MARPRPCRGCPAQSWRGGNYCQMCVKLCAVEVVPNDPFRERYLELRELADDPKDVAGGICAYMHSKGYKSYMKRKGKYIGAETSYLTRRLGLMQLASTYKYGRRYEGGFTRVLKYEEAVELSRAMGMIPVEAGV